MKKNLASNLFLFSGILTLLSGMINEDKSLGLTLGCAFITLGILARKKEESEKNSKELPSEEHEKEAGHKRKGEKVI